MLEDDHLFIYLFIFQEDSAKPFQMNENHDVFSGMF